MKVGHAIARIRSRPDIPEIQPTPDVCKTVEPCSLRSQERSVVTEDKENPNLSYQVKNSSTDAPLVADQVCQPSPLPTQAAKKKDSQDAEIILKPPVPAPKLTACPPAVVQVDVEDELMDPYQVDVEDVCKKRSQLKDHRTLNLPGNTSRGTQTNYPITSDPQDFISAGTGADKLISLADRSWIPPTFTPVEPVVVPELNRVSSKMTPTSLGTLSSMQGDESTMSMSSMDNTSISDKFQRGTRDDPVPSQLPVETPLHLEVYQQHPVGIDDNIADSGSKPHGDRFQMSTASSPRPPDSWSIRKEEDHRSERSSHVSGASSKLENVMSAFLPKGLDLLPAALPMADRMAAAALRFEDMLKTNKVKKLCELRDVGLEGGAGEVRERRPQGGQQVHGLPRGQPVQKDPNFEASIGNTSSRAFELGRTRDSAYPDVKGEDDPGGLRSQHPQGLQRVHVRHDLQKVQNVFPSAYGPARMRHSASFPDVGDDGDPDDPRRLHPQDPQRVPDERSGQIRKVLSHVSRSKETDLEISCCLDLTQAAQCKQESSMSAVIPKTPRFLPTYLWVAVWMAVAVLKFKTMLDVVSSKVPSQLSDGGLEGEAGEVREAHPLEGPRVQDVPQLQSGRRIFSLQPNVSAPGITEARIADESEPKSPCSLKQGVNRSKASRKGYKVIIRFTTEGKVRQKLMPINKLLVLEKFEG